MLTIKIDLNQAILEYIAECTIEINRYDGNINELVIQDGDGRKLSRRIYINDHRIEKDGKE